jgi:hypothetical protein
VPPFLTISFSFASSLFGDDVNFDSVALKNGEKPPMLLSPMTGTSFRRFGPPMFNSDLNLGYRRV